jgi:GTP cyclohydrolase IA
MSASVELHTSPRLTRTRLPHGALLHAGPSNRGLRGDSAGNGGLAPFIDMDRAEMAVRDLLVAVGEDPDREGLEETPRRVAKMYRELFQGLAADPAVHLRRVFHEKCDEVVLLRDIDFFSLCEHHLLPFHGKAHVAYLPEEKVVGLSKLARTVDAFARRPQVQERMTSQIADALMDHLGPKGAVVVVEAEHLCMKMRGVQKPNGVMVTSAVRGIFKHDPAARAEVMALINRYRR